MDPPLTTFLGLNALAFLNLDDSLIIIIANLAYDGTLPFDDDDMS